MKSLIIVCLMVTTLCVMANRHEQELEKKDVDQPSVLMKRMKRSHHLSHLEKVKLWRQRRNMTLEKALVKKLKEELAEVRAEVAKLQKALKHAATSQLLTHAELVAKFKRLRELRDSNLRKARMRKAILAHHNTM